MSLFKQVSLVLSFIFAILFILITAVSFKIIKDSTEKSLYENLKNISSDTGLVVEYDYSNFVLPQDYLFLIIFG